MSGVHLSETSHFYHWQSLNKLGFWQNMHKLVLLAVGLLGAEESVIEAVLLLLRALAAHWVVEGTAEVVYHFILAQGRRTALSNHKELLLLVSRGLSLSVCLVVLQHVIG